MSDSDNQVPVNNLPVTVHAQYVKDISFENPAAPFSLRNGLENPKMDININMDVKNIEDPNIKSLYEVTLRVSATAKRQDEIVYIAEVSYGVAVSMPNIAQEHHHPLLLVEMPKLAFPFVRKILADLVQDGGYQPLLLGPVDFASMYMSRFGNQAQATESAENAEQKRAALN